ncbi:MAG: hypothetical protein M3Q80_02325 [bacterium]|nr:hypothetical protein [bacterium]
MNILKAPYGNLLISRYIEKKIKTNPLPWTVSVDGSKLLDTKRQCVLECPEKDGKAYLVLINAEFGETYPQFGLN